MPGRADGTGEFASASQNQFFHYKDFWYGPRRASEDEDNELWKS